MMELQLLNQLRMQKKARENESNVTMAWGL